jgi:hypothetical protein
MGRTPIRNGSTASTTTSRPIRLASRWAEVLPASSGVLRSGTLARCHVPVPFETDDSGSKQGERSEGLKENKQTVF